MLRQELMGRILDAYRGRNRARDRGDIRTAELQQHRLAALLDQLATLEHPDE